MHIFFLFYLLKQNNVNVVIFNNFFPEYILEHTTIPSMSNPIPINNYNGKQFTCQKDKEIQKCLISENKTKKKISDNKYKKYR